MNIVYVLLIIFVENNFTTTNIDTDTEVFSSKEQCLRAKENVKIPKEVDSYNLSCFEREVN